MSEETVHQPHDKLFRATFADPRNTAAFLRHHLGGPLASQLDWDTLTLEPGSFIDTRMEGSEADLLFRTNLRGTSAYVYLLWEHQRREAPLMGLRLLSYMVRIWTKLAEQHGTSVKLSPILPVVLAQDRNHWRTSTRFHELFEFPTGAWEAVRGLTPDFAFRLLQLADLPYEEIRGTPEGILTLRTLKAEPLGELLHSLVWDNALITGISREAAERFFRYVLNADVDTTAFRAKVSNLQPKDITQIAMTLADRLRQEGRKEGHQEGWAQGQRHGEIQSLREAVLAVLDERFGPIPSGLADELRSLSNLEKLQALLKVALTVSEVEAFTERM